MELEVMPCSNHTMAMVSPSAGVPHTPHTMNHELLRAATTGDTSLLEHALGLRSAAGKRCRRSFLKGVTSEGNTALHIAAGRGYLEHARILCDLDASLVRARNNLRNTPLICAARGGHVDVVCYLIEHPLAPAAPAAAYAGASSGEEPMLRARNSEGATAMHEAVRNGHVAVLAKLMSADAGLAAVVDGKGFSPLFLAAALGRADMVHVLIAGAAPDAGGVRSPAYYAGPDGLTALHAAVVASEEISKSLWCWEPTLAKKADNSGKTALHHAASAGKLGVVKLLLLEDASLAYIPDVDGLFPVHTAAKMGKVDIIGLLMETCPNSDELLDKRGRNVLHCAVEHNKEKVVQHIMCKSPRLGRMTNARDGGGNTPLHLAANHGCDRIALLLVRDVKVSLSTMNNDGATPLDVAISKLDRRRHTYRLNPEVLIVQCLLWCGAHRSPLRRDGGGDDGCSEEELNEYTKLTQNRVMVSALFATVTFGVPFSQHGIAGPVDRPAFWALLLSSALAFLCSAAATCLLMYAGRTTVHPRYRSRYHVWSSNLLHVGLLLVIATFTFGVHLAPGTVVVPGWTWKLEAAVCAMACVFVVFTVPGTWWPMVLAKPIWARLGLKGLLGMLRGPRPIPSQKLLLWPTPRLALLRMLATLLILALILSIFLLDMSYLRLPATQHRRFSSNLLVQNQHQFCSYPT